jgi:hypothetical protein
VIVNNALVSEPENDGSGGYSVQLNNHDFKRAKTFAKKSLQCKAYKINIKSKEGKVQLKVDNAVGTLIELAILEKEET